MNTQDIIEIFNTLLRQHNYKIVERSNLLSPYFKGEFNLSGAHSYLIPAVQSDTKIDVDKIGVTDLVVREVDLEIVGISRSHLLLFEMGVFGSFGYMDDIGKEIYTQLKVLYDFFNKIGLDISKIHITICNGGKYLNKQLEYDKNSYTALKTIGFNTNNIIKTQGRRNFMLSRGIDRLAGYNIEFFYEKNGEYVEIASSNIYKYLNKLSYLFETVNNGVGCGVGFERLSYVLNDNVTSVSKIEPFSNILQNIITNLNIKGAFLITDKLNRAIEITKSIIFILNDGITYDKSPQGKKLKKYLAKVSSELDYISVDKMEFVNIVYTHIDKYYKEYNLNKNIIKQIDDYWNIDNEQNLLHNKEKNT